MYRYDRKAHSRQGYVILLNSRNGIVALEYLPEDTVIGRLTGDGAGDSLLAPEWSRRKTAVLNNIDKEMYRRGAYQGKKCNT